MNVNETHLAIAKERFLELMAQHPNGDPTGAAVTAIEEADAFRKAYNSIGQAVTPEPKMKGCPRCFGSGGKKNSPCPFCAGSGKVPADD